MISVLPATLYLFISRLLGLTDPPNPSIPFYLRHAHAIDDTFGVVFQDVPQSLTARPVSVGIRPIRASRPRFSTNGSVHQLEWDDVGVPGPDVESRETLLELAKMTYNAYNESPESDGSWYELESQWNTSIPFGWAPPEDGFRGHIYVAEDESTVIIAIKGTSAPWIVGGEGPTKKKDKHNNNMLFSCCCARAGPMWSTVCPCYAGSGKCDIGCVQQAMMEDRDLFYHLGTELYNNVSYMYPDADIWVTGHSLGGALSSLLGVTFGIPAVAFESPGDKMAASRLHLPLPPSTHHITHVYHTADPVPMGACNGMRSLCAIGGYAVESRCHLGNSIIYDTVSEFHWGVDLRNHPIKVIIEQLLQADWGPAVLLGREVPVLTEEDAECQDCQGWRFGEFGKSFDGECKPDATSQEVWSLE